MVLATHFVVGSAIASFFPNQPIVGFGLAFLSHFALDAIPHWDYKLKSKVENENDPLDSDMSLNKNFIRDLFVMGADVFIGILLSVFVLGGAGQMSVLAILAGGLGGIMPDFLQFVYMKIRRDPFTSLQQFHHFIHAKKEIRNPVAGIFWQLLIVAAVFILL